MEFLIFTLVMIGLIAVFFFIAPYLIVAGLVIWAIALIAKLIRRSSEPKDTESDSTSEYTYTTSRRNPNPDVIDVEYTEREDDGNDNA